MPYNCFAKIMLLKLIFWVLFVLTNPQLTTLIYLCFEWLGPELQLFPIQVYGYFTMLKREKTYDILFASLGTKILPK